MALGGGGAFKLFKDDGHAFAANEVEQAGIGAGDRAGAIARPVVDDQLAIDPQPAAAIDDQFKRIGLRKLRQDFARPAARKVVGVHAHGRRAHALHRAIRPSVVNHRIDPGDDAIGEQRRVGGVIEIGGLIEKLRPQTRAVGLHLIVDENRGGWRKSGAIARMRGDADDQGLVRFG